MAEGLASGALHRDAGLHGSLDRERLDEHGNPILGGELLVQVVDAQVWLPNWLIYSDGDEPTDQYCQTHEQADNTCCTATTTFLLWSPKNSILQ